MRETETECEWVGAEREGDTRSEAGSRLWSVSTEPDAGLELTSCEIMTWAQVGSSTDWATQVPLLLLISMLTAFWSESFIIFFLFTLLEVFYLKIHFLTLKGFFILNALILFFGIWNYIILAFHAENQSFNYSIDNYILNILVNIGLFITVLLFGIVQLVNSKLNKNNKK